MSKKTWILISCLVLSLTLGLGGSLAYLTDRDSDVNVFTMGNVDIDLTEDFDQGSVLMPNIKIVKDVRVENIGPNDAWVWVEIAIPQALDTPDNAAKNVIHFNYAKDSVEEGKWTWWDEDGNWMVEEGVTLDDTDIKYNVYTVLWQSPLAPATTTEASAMFQVYLDEFVDIDPEGNLHRVYGGEITDYEWNVNADQQGYPLMYVAAYAIQTAGIEDVRTAYGLYNKQWGDAGKVEFDASESQSKVPETVYDAEAFAQTAADGKNVALGTNLTLADNYVFDGVAIDGRGYAITAEEYDYNSDCLLTVQSGTISNLQILGAPRAIGTGSSGTYGLTGDLNIYSVYVDEATYGINIGNGNGKSVYVQDSEIFGWNSVDGADVTFKSCTLGTRNGYSGYVVVYDDIIFDNCDFEKSLQMCGRATTTPGTVVEINNCAFWPDGRDVEDTMVYVTAENFVDLFLDVTDTDVQYLKDFCTIKVNGTVVTW